MQHPPAELEAGPVRLVRVGPGRVDGIAAAVRQSLPELTPFMDWAADSPSRAEDFGDFIADSVAQWAAGTAYNYVITDGSEVIGGCGLMRRVGPGAIEIGYWVRSDRTGAGVATTAAGLLADAATRLEDVARIEIHHDEANIASGRVAEKLGFDVAERRLVEIDLPGESGVEVVWVKQCEGCGRDN